MYFQHRALDLIHGARNLARSWIQPAWGNARLQDRHIRGPGIRIISLDGADDQIHVGQFRMDYSTRNPGHA